MPGVHGLGAELRHASSCAVQCEGADGRIYADLRRSIAITRLAIDFLQHHAVHDHVVEAVDVPASVEVLAVTRHLRHHLHKQREAIEVVRRAECDALRHQLHEHVAEPLVVVLVDRVALLVDRGSIAQHFRHCLHFDIPLS